MKLTQAQLEMLEKLTPEELDLAIESVTLKPGQKAPVPLMSAVGMTEASEVFQNSVEMALVIGRKYGILRSFTLMFFHGLLVGMKLEADRAQAAIVAGILKDDQSQSNNESNQSKDEAQAQAESEFVPGLSEEDQIRIVERSEAQPGPKDPTPTEG